MKTSKDLKRLIKQKTASPIKAAKNLLKPKGHAIPIYVFGVQRSGTTMMLECFEQLSNVEVLGEVSKATVNIKLKSNEEIKTIINESKFDFVAFKPLMESAKAAELLSLKEGSKALWLFRKVEDRASSAVELFGDHNLQVLTAFAEGKMLDSWQADGMTKENLDLVKSFDWGTMSPQNAAAVFWYIRNSLYFDMGFDKRDDIMPVAYEELVLHPEETLMRICKFVGCNYVKQMAEIIHGKSVGKGGDNLDKRVAELCYPLYDRLATKQKAFFSNLDHL